MEAAVMRVTLIWLLLFLLAGCGGPTWHGLTRQVAQAEQRLEAGDPVGAATYIQAASADLDPWLDSPEGRALRGDLEAGHARLGRWTLATYRSRAIPRARLWMRVQEDPLAAAFVAAGRQPVGLRAVAYLDVALELAQADRIDDARVVLDAAEEAGAAREISPLVPALLPGLVDLACFFDDAALLGDALGRIEAAATRGLDDDGLLLLREETARSLALHGRCDLVLPQLDRLSEALEARWREHDPYGAVVPEGVPFPWNEVILRVLLDASASCRGAGDLDGALALIDEAVPRAEAEGDLAVDGVAKAYLDAGLPGEAAALAGSLDEPAARVWLLLAATDAWRDGARPDEGAVPLREDVLGWLEAAEAAGWESQELRLLEAVAERWQSLGESERAAAVRSRARSRDLMK